MELDDDENIILRIRSFLAQQSNLRDPNFDPAPFLIEILKEKQSDQQAILERQKQLIDLENQAFDLIDQICGENSDQFFRLLDIPQKQGAQLQKLKSNMSVVKKKVKQTKSLLMATQKDIDQLHWNCLYNKLIYKSLKQMELKVSQYEIASIALKNNEFLACATNLPVFKSSSVLETALAAKSKNLQLHLLSRGVEEVTLFLYLTPKIVLPASQSLIDRVSSDESFLSNIKKHEAFHKRYQLFKKAFCLNYLPSLWSFRDLQKKAGKIHMIYDIVRAIMYIGHISQVAVSLQLECKKSINSIFILLLYFFSNQIAEQMQNKEVIKKDSRKWFLSQSCLQHTTFVSTVIDIIGVILRKLSIIRIIFKEFEIEQANKFTTFHVFQLLLHELNQLIQDVYVKDEDHHFDFVKQEIMKKIKFSSNYIYWGGIRNIVVKSMVIIQTNLRQVENNYELGGATDLEWESIVKIEQFDKKFYQKFHVDMMKALSSIFSHEGKSYAFEPLQQISNMKNIGEKQLNFCRFFTSEEMKFSKQYVFTIGFMGAIVSFFKTNNFDPIRCEKYVLFLLSVFYLKLNYYLQRFMISAKTLQMAYQLRKINNKLKTKEKDFLRQFDKIYVKSKQQVVIKPWRRGIDEEVEPSKYRMVQNLKAIEKQNLMLLTYYVKNLCDLQKYKESENVSNQINIYEKLEPTNYDQNFHAKLIRIWDQLPQIEHSIAETTLALFQKILQLHLVIISIIYLESSAN